MHGPSLKTSLQVPDALAWRKATGYSSEAAEALGRAYYWIRNKHLDADAYRHAYAAIVPFRARAISLQQRMNMATVFAQAYASEEDFSDAARSTDKALGVAQFLADRPAEVELHFLRGNVTDAQLRLREARSHYTDALNTLQTLPSTGVPVDADYELTLTIRRAAMSFELAEYDTALDLLTGAHTLQMSWLPNDQKQAAYIAWLTAQVLRFNGELDSAFATILTAADQLLSCDELSMSGRIQTIVAETALDRAETFFTAGSPTAQESFVTLAAPYAQRALSHARQSGDRVGGLLARLALLRIDRLRGKVDSRIPSLEVIVRRARKLGDAALLGRALAGLADDFQGRGERESARNCYRLAWRTLEEHELRAMAQAPRLAFFHVGELDA